MPAPVIARVAQAHRVAAGQSAVEAHAKLARIGEARLGLVTRRARHGAIGRETFVIEQHPPQCRARVSHGIIRGRVILTRDGRHEVVRRQQRRGVVVAGRGQQQRIRHCAWDVLARGIKLRAIKHIPAPGAVKCLAEMTVVDFPRAHFRPGGEVGRGLENPDVVAGIGELHPVGRRTAGHDGQRGARGNLRFED